MVAGGGHDNGRFDGLYYELFGASTRRWPAGACVLSLEEISTRVRLLLAADLRCDSNGLPEAPPQLHRWKQGKKSADGII